MPRLRSTLPLLGRVLSLACVAGATSAAGCASEGSYQVRWTFRDPGLGVFQPGDCGKYGVSAIAIIGRRDDGQDDNPVAACAPGVFIHGLPTGTWTLKLVALDATG